MSTADTPELGALALEQLAEVSIERRGQQGEQSDFVVVEGPLQIRIGGRPLAMVMRTPGHDLELAVGFLVGEGVLSKRSDLEDWVLAGDLDGVVELSLDPSLETPLDRLERHIVASAACGVCGRSSIEDLTRRLPTLESHWRVPASLLHSLPMILRRGQVVFESCGGSHAAGLFDKNGDVVAIREDIGRHNAVDKLVGHALLADELPLDQSMLMVSGRVSFEIVQKALMAGIPLVAAVSAPSSLAVDLAKEHGLTLIAFLRGERYSVFANSHRLEDLSEPVVSP